MPISCILNKIWVVIYCWKALELCFSKKGTPALCLGALRPYWRIYGIHCIYPLLALALKTLLAQRLYGITECSVNIRTISPCV